MRNQSPRRSSGEQLNRGRNMESWVRESRDEDLALFQDMRSRERKNFLHPSNDDIEASLSTKFGGLTGYRLPSSTPPRKANNDLLSMDSEKNDYDWLLTPPGTPLFPSLDQDAPLTHNLERIAVSQAHPASRLSELGAREVRSNVSRGSPSLRRPSTALSASSSNSSVRGRPSSPSRICLSPTHRSSAPPRSLGRTSTRQQGPSTRSSTPTVRRCSTSPAKRASSTERVRPPLNGQSRETSLKLQAWQAPVLGFRMETPPNLRTSIPDRPPSASRSVISSSRHCDARNSYSEAADITRTRWCNASSFGSRSSSSSISQDRYSSKGSVISSSDDGLEISQPNTSDNKTVSPKGTAGDARIFARSEDQASRNNSSRKHQFKPTSTFVETSVLSNASVRKSLEPSMRQVDHRRVPQTMFRPLLSSAPASSFYNGGHSIVQYGPSSPIVEPSITASSNASSEQGVRIVPGGESSDEEDKVTESEWDNKNLFSEVAASKTGADEDDMPNPEYMDIILGRCARHDYTGHFRQGSDDISSSVDTNDFNRDDQFKMNKVGVDNISDWTRQEALSERTWNSSEAGDHVMDNLVIASRFQTDEFDYGSVDDDSTGKDSQRDVTISLCGDSIADQLFMDIQEDVPVQAYSKLEDCGYSKLQGEAFLCDEKPESETLHISQTFKLSSTPDEETLQGATHTAEYESVILSPQRQIDLLWPKDSNNGSDSKQTLSTDVVTGHLPVHERHRNSNICTSKVPPGHGKEEYCTSLHSDSTVDSQGLFKSSAITCAAGLSDTRNLVEIDRGASAVRNVASVSNFSIPKVDGSVLDEFLAQRECTASVNMDSSLNCGIPNGTQSLACFELAAERPFDHSPRTEKLVCTYSKEELNAYSCNGSALPLKRDDGDVTPKSQKSSNQCDLASEDNAVSPDEFVPMCQAGLIVEEPQLVHLDEVVSLSGTPEVTVPKEKTSINEAGGISVISVAERGSPEVLGPGLETQNLSTDEPLEMKVAFEGGPFLSDHDLLSSEESQQFCSSDSKQSIVQSPQRVSMPGNSPDHLSTLTEDATYESQGDQITQTSMSHGGNGGQTGFKDAHRTKENLEWKPVARNFNLEETTNRILFCSSIVHDLVYRAVSTAAEKEDSVSQAQPYPVGVLVKHEFSRADYNSSYKGKALKSGNWIGRHTEAILAVAVRRSLTNHQNKHEEVDEIPTMTVHPAPINGMSDGMDEETIPADATRIKDDRSPAKFTVNTNCQCAVM